MAEDALLATDPATDFGAAAGEPGTRGRTEISTRVTERIAEVAATRVPGVARQDATFGRGLPRAEARQTGERVRLQLRIAVLWGRPLAQVAADTRTAVAGQVNALTGLVVDTVDVEIDTVLPVRELAVAQPRRVL
ncbi:Asp23/Gls24 family envelope stress response protein [Kribbella sp. CA-293567]|uniref:Asp23/Gls24 family envelope stress response protein n=1 Tax=Kribbella sp. CA-293567 TaxID=3002436 RepID=UPI0022DD34FF|nr:Asp23/Gls24 family envelope stress response protein [Kribbella sp. CA-293567]WBQ04671.1 Asp23/Gls24 family envelope stress response protein [Kribbella sp. CA-293567]